MILILIRRANRYDMADPCSFYPFFLPNTYYAFHEQDYFGVVSESEDNRSIAFTAGNTKSILVPDALNSLQYHS